MGSFAGVSFNERGNDATTWPVWDAGSDLNIRKIPGGDVSQIQYSGATLPQFSLRVRVSAANLAALVALVPSSGTLVYFYETTTAILQSITGAEQIGVSGQYWANLSFIRATAF